MLRTIAIYLFVLFLVGCYASGISYRNLAYLYKQEPVSPQPDYVLHNVRDSINRVYFTISRKKILYAKEPSGSHFTARVEVCCKVLNDYQSIPTDTVCKVFIDSSYNNLEHPLNGYFDVTSIKDDTRLLEFVFTDLNRKQYQSTYLEIDRVNNNTQYQFFVSGEDTSQPFFRNYFNTDQPLNVKVEGAERVFVEYYENNFRLAFPPFHETNTNRVSLKADSLFELQKTGPGMYSLSMEKEGIYFLQAESDTKEGLALYRFHNGFPAVTLIDQMILPLQYITSKKEFEALSNAKDRKEALDNFWLDCADNPERAKVIIKKFYTRIAQCNELFTSYLEGWKTDRGLIYLIYGPPNAVYRTSESESWVYGEEQNFSSINFMFTKIKNPFTDNDYELNRSSIYQNSWYTMVESWRHGRVYSVN